MKRQRARGAAFVESIIVVSVFSLCFLGAMYFRALYIQKARAQRLARASAMSYAQGACSGDPKSGLTQDLPPDQPPPTTTSGTPLNTSPPNDKYAGPSVQAFDNTSHGGPFDPVTGITVQTTASATNRRQGFSSQVGSTSYVACMAPTSPDQSKEIFNQIESTIQSIFNEH